MSQRLYLVRHGEAAAGSGRDSDRELTTQGRQQLNRLLEKWPDESLLGPIQTLYVSPYLRTRQTASLFLQGLALTETALVIEPRLTPDTSCQQWQAEDFAALGDNALLITHQPLISKLLGVLLHADASRGPAMAPGSLALLTAEDWLPGCAELQALYHPPDYSSNQRYEGS